MNSIYTTCQYCNNAAFICVELSIGEKTPMCKECYGTYSMKILNITKIVCMQIETNEGELGMYRRHNADDWEILISGRWISFYDKLNMEKLYQVYIKTHKNIDIKKEE